MVATYARIQDGLVVELFDLPPDSPPIDEMFHADLVWRDVTAISPPPQFGWTYDGATYAAPVVSTPTPSAAEVLAEKLALGIAITSTGNPSLNATYALDDVSTTQISQLGIYANAFSTFPGGATQAYPDINGTPHTFTVAQFVAFLRAVAPLVSAMEMQASIQAHGGSPTWPAQSANIV